MPKLVCVSCNRELKIKKNGVLAQENTSGQPGAMPYKIWPTDKWECPECEVEILAGFSTEGYHNNHPKFREILKEVNLIFY